MTFRFLRDDGQFAPFGSTTATPFQTIFTNILSSNTTSSTTGTWILGPSVSQGSSGIWLINAWATISGAVTGSAVLAHIVDGLAQATIASGSYVSEYVGTEPFSFALSGIISSPSSNISLLFTGIGGGVTMFRSGSATLPSSSDSGITAVRIG